MKEYVVAATANDEILLIDVSDPGLAKRLVGCYIPRPSFSQKSAICCGVGREAVRNFLAKKGKSLK